MTLWTEEQSTAIGDRGNTLLVAAGAGSGKTAVLVERIVKLVLQDGVDVDRLLVMTFTKAAAGELRQRVAGRLEEALEAAQDREAVIRQLDRLEGAQISTMHAFCASLIRRYFNRLDIDPGYRLLDDEERALLEEEVLHEVFESFYQRHGCWFEDLIRHFPSGTGDEGLRRCVRDLDRFLLGCPDPDEWMAEQLAQWEQQSRAFARSQAGRTLLDRMRKEILQAEEFFFLAQKLAHEELTFYKSVVDQDRELLFQLRQSADDGLSALFTALDRMSFARLSGKPRQFDGDPEALDAFKLYREEMKGILNSLKDYQVGTLRQMEEMAGTIHRMLTGLQRVRERFRRELNLRMRRDNVLTFDDLERLALELLLDEEMQKEVRDHYLYVLVDEYQDTSLVQEAIVQRVSGPDNLFMVGDMKQSIYRFRQAAPEVFRDKKQRFLEDGDSPEKLISLNRNFRCSEPIIRTVNHLFSRLMSPELGEIEYDQHEELNYGNGLDDEKTPVSFIFLDRDEAEDEDALYADLDYMEREALAAARILKDQLGTTFYDHKQGRTRTLSWKDMVVILRTPKNWGDKYLEMFRREGIPAYKDLPLGYFEVTEIGVLLNMLRLADNSRQDEPWLSLLRCPAVGLTDEQLARIRAASPEGSYREAMTAYAGDHPGDTGTTRVNRAMALVSAWQQAARYLTLEELINRVLKTTDWYALVGAMPGGEGRQANIRLFLERARDYGKIHPGGLKGFLYWTEGRRERDFDPGVASTVGENADVVRIMSAHRSKGLEYPLVLIGAMGKQFNLTDAADPMLMHKSLGLGPRYVNPELGVSVPTVSRLLIRDAVLTESKSEELRILYVAATRARNRLVFVGGIRQAQWDKLRFRMPEGMIRGRSWGDWLVPLLHGKLPSCMTVGLWTGEMDRSLIRRRSDRRTAWREALVRQMEEPVAGAVQMTGSGWPQASRLPSKLAVTDLYRIQSGAGLEEPPQKVVLREKPRFLEGTRAPTGLERGLALHQVMQQLDLTGDLSEGGIREQLEGMVRRELLSGEEAGWVQPETLAGFFQSQPGQRLLRARWVRREVPFNLTMGAGRVFPELSGSDEQILVQGVIDLVFAEEHGLVLMDYKTDAPENIRQNLDRYRQQLSVYREALERILNEPVREVMLYLFSTQDVIRLEE